MSKIYYGDRASGGSLKHYRTKGSRNGYSKNPNYKVVGQRAKGRLVNGRYVYDNPYLSSYGKLKKAGVNEAVRSIDNGAKNNWQQQANETSATNRMLNEHLQKRTAYVNMLKNNTTYKAMQKHNIFTKGWDGAIDNSYANASARVAAGKRVSTPHRTQVASAKSKGDPRYSIEALSKKGAKNNWQQQAIKAAAQGNLTGKIARGEVGAAKANNGDVYSARELGYQGSSKSKKSGSKSAKRSKEYEEELAYNSQRNVYPSGSSGASSRPKTPSGMGHDPRYSVPGTQELEKAKQEAARKAKEKETKGQYFTYDEKTGTTVKTSPGIEAEKARIEAGKKRHAKVRAKRERAAKRAALINKIKDKISSFFKKKKK